jgi:hypothetical protein
MRPFGLSVSELLAMMRLFLKQERSIQDICKFYYIDEEDHRELLLLLLSILIRSPANRNAWERFPTRIGRAPNEEVGKANMLQSYSIAKNICENQLLSNRYFVLLHSYFRRFLFGDGNLDWVTSSLNGLQIHGRALVPLTPNLCVYFCSPRVMRPSPNCASLLAPNWMVDHINELVQLHSRDKVFFLGKPPKLTRPFIQQDHFEHRVRKDPVIDMLDEIACAREKELAASSLLFP